MRVSLTTLGCKVNHYETQAMQELFERAGWEIVPFPAPADAYVINTCTVTGASDAKSRRLISRAHKANPNALIAAVGCYAQSAPEQVSALPGVGLVVGTDGRGEIVGRVEAALKQRRFPTEAGALAESAALSGVTDIRQARGFEPLSAVRDGRTRATLKIQDGCRNYCAYCIIPYARGPIRSRPMEDIRRELSALAGEGYREVVLTGIHLNSYGLDLSGCDLVDVLALTRRIDGLARVRLGSLEPKYIDERFVRALAENPAVCRQFHLSLQSGSDTVLERMNRRYTTAEYVSAVERLRRAMPDCAVTTDVIAGFCGETEEEHRETMAFLERVGFARIHVFPFSVRKGTRAATMPGQLEKAVKERRAGELIQLGKRMTNAFLQRQIGCVAEVLAETGGCGYTGNYVRVRTCAPEGTIVRMRITAIEQETAIGEELERI